MYLHSLKYKALFTFGCALNLISTNNFNIRMENKNRCAIQGPIKGRKND